MISTSGGFELDDDPERIDSDGAAFAYLADAFIVGEARGAGLGKELA